MCSNMANLKLINWQWISLFLWTIFFTCSPPTVGLPQNINNLIQQTKENTLLPNFYHWMERNSYICEAGAVFLTESEAIQFNCIGVCGDPLEKFTACARKEPTGEPTCEQVPELCIREFIQEFVLALGETRGEILLQDFSLSELLSQRDSQQERESMEQLGLNTTELPTTIITTIATPTTSTTTFTATSSSTTTSRGTATNPSTTSSSTTTTTASSKTISPTSLAPSRSSTSTPITTARTSTTTTTPITTTTSTTTTTPITTTTSTTTTTPITTTAVRTTTSAPDTTTSTTEKVLTTQSTSGSTTFESGFETVDGDVLANNSKVDKTDSIDKKTVIGRLLHKFKAVVARPAEPFFENVFRGKLLTGTSKKNCPPDGHSCEFWARVGECLRNPKYMLIICKRACGVCQSQKSTDDEIRVI